MASLKNDPMILDDEFGRAVIPVFKIDLTNQEIKIPQHLMASNIQISDKSQQSGFFTTNLVLMEKKAETKPVLSYLQHQNISSQVDDALKCLNFEQKYKLINRKVMYLLRLKVDVRDFYYHIGTTEDFMTHFDQINKEYKTDGKILIICIYPIQGKDDENELRRKYLKEYIVKNIAIRGTDKRKLFQIHSDVYINFVKFCNEKKYEPIYTDPKYAVFNFPETNPPTFSMIKYNGTYEKYGNTLYSEKANIYPCK